MLDKSEDELPPSEHDGVELELLVEGLQRLYGLDFRGYARGSLLRRVRNAVADSGVENISALQSVVLHDEHARRDLTERLSVPMTSLFRDPSFFSTFRSKVVPLLEGYPFIRIWHAGCSTGEEVYSMAILLEEAGLLDRTRMYATDMNEASLKVARNGAYPLRLMREYTTAYLQAGGTRAFSEYYRVEGELAIFDHRLRERAVFAHHNLAVDGSFNEFHVVLCRNVLIYFDMALQDRVHRLFFASLRRFGVLCLGGKETLRHSAFADDYEALDEEQRIYRRGA